MRYAKDVATDVIRYRFHKMGFGSGELAFADGRVRASSWPPRPRTGSCCRGWGWPSPSASWTSGCSTAASGELLRLRGTLSSVSTRGSSTGWVIDSTGSSRPISVGALPPEVGGDFDVVLGADVFEHLPEPAALLGPGSATCFGPAGW